MSSPYVPSQIELLDRRTMSSPLHSASCLFEQDDTFLRPMRLKVLYTFDSENKTNCLARWPHTLNIRTALLDENTQIGVIELKTCIQAIVAASPEITAKLGQDYTIYAYDYSEYETPLVGQGMLSWVLASASPTPSAPAHRSSAVVTGRVCKNILGLFGNGMQETLEVKLRLVPVPTCLQSEYIESMRKYRDLSRIMPENFDPQIWTKFVKANPELFLQVGSNRSQSPGSTSDMSHHGIEHIQQLISSGYRVSSSDHREPSLRRTSSATTILSGHETGRTHSPTPSLQFTTINQPMLRDSNQNHRTNSRASSHSNKAHARRLSSGSVTDCGMFSSEERLEEGPSRKRAKVMKAKHPGKFGFGKSADSLRVTASTAASVRVFQPAAVRPSADLIESLEDPPRIPTPFPQDASKKKDGNPPVRRSLLSESIYTSDSGYKSQGQESDMNPDENRFAAIEYSLETLGSSPPLLRDCSMAPSSPVLPVLPHPENSMFAGETENLFAGSNGNYVQNKAAGIKHNKIDEATSLHIQNGSHTRIKDSADTFQILSSRDGEEAKKRELSMLNARKALGLKRSQTWAGDKRDPDTAPNKKRRSETRSGTTEPRSRGGWDKEKRRKAIQTKLNSSLQAGEMPPFCENCGAIETPTWRKAYSRLHSGDHSQVVTSNEDGGILAVQVVEMNEDGSTKTFKIYKKSKGNEHDDEGFVDVLLCNPCGIYLSKLNCMRPSHLWNKDKSISESSKGRTRKSRAKKNINQDVDYSDFTCATSDGTVLTFENSNPFSSLDTNRGIADRDCAEVEAVEFDPLAGNAEMHFPEIDISPQERSNDKIVSTNSAPDIESSTIEALQWAIQSSPGQSRFLGKAQCLARSDEQDPTLERRTLFRSPRTSGPLGSSANSQKSRAVSTDYSKTTDMISTTKYIDDQANKENLPPRPLTPDDGLEDLFSSLSPPVSPRAFRNPCKSPEILKIPRMRCSPDQQSLTTGDTFSSTSKAFFQSPRTPVRASMTRNPQPSIELTPFTIHINQLLSENPNTGPSHSQGDIETLQMTEISTDVSQDEILNGGTSGRILAATDFSFEAFESSDLPVPSSPPWLQIYEDP